jgi:hypothetical protein
MAIRAAISLLKITCQPFFQSSVIFALFFLFSIDAHSVS